MPSDTVDLATLPCCLSNSCKGCATFGEVACNLVHKQGSGNTAGLGNAGNGDIVGHNHHFDFLCQGRGPFRQQGRSSACRPCSS